MYHAESDSVFEIHVEDIESFYESSFDASLCIEVTGDPTFESRFRREQVSTH